MVQQAGGLLGGAQAIGLQQDALQLGIRIGDGGGVIAKGANDFHKQCRKHEHCPVEFHEEPRDEVRGKGGVDISEPHTMPAKLASSPPLGGREGGSRILPAMQAASRAARAAVEGGHRGAERCGHGLSGIVGCV